MTHSVVCVCVCVGAWHRISKQHESLGGSNVNTHTHLHTHISPHTCLSLSLTRRSLPSQFPSHSSVTRQLSPGLRTPYEIIPMPTLALWLPWQPSTEQWSHQVTEGQVIGECVCLWMCTRVIMLCVCVCLRLFQCHSCHRASNPIQLIM